MWRNTALVPQFFIVQADCLIPMAIWALHICWLTFYIAAGGVTLFLFLRRRDWTPMIMFRRSKRLLAGPIRPVTPRVVWRRRTHW